jgi:NAD-dependent deacetylase
VLSAKQSGYNVAMLETSVVQAARILRSSRRVVVLSGAGVSAESGVPTFRGAGGLWEGRRVEEVATPEAFDADPVSVWRFYEERRCNLVRLAPNPAHRVLAAWQDRFPSYTLVTQNVDGLHQAAGSRVVLELHGSIWRVRCTSCGREREERRVPLPELPSSCPVCHGLERPAVVWFGEYLPSDVGGAAIAAAETCEVLVVVGTSAIVYPAAGLVAVAAGGGATVIEVNPEASAQAHLATVTLRAPAGEVLPLVEAWLKEG